MQIFIFVCSLWLWNVLSAQADLYQWTDENGVIHVVDDAGEIPEAYQDSVKVYRAATPATLSGTLVAPSRTYAADSQGAFAQKLALDLGLIKNSAEDALSPLTGAGIQPAGGWRVGDSLTSESVDEIVAAARRAAETKRLSLSADGSEAVARQAANLFLPSPPVAQPLPPPEEYEEAAYEEEPEVVVIEQPPQIIEVIREPYYVPPIIVGVPAHPPHHRHPHKRGNKPIPPPAPPTGPHTTRPGPTHMPPWATHLPPGLSHPSPFMNR